MIDLQNEVQYADEAFALDWYKDESGYTNIGKAVYDIKYDYIKNNILSDEQLDYAIEYLVEQLMPFVSDCDAILPAPSFNPYHKGNLTGELKMMYMIAACLSEVSKIPVYFDILEKTSPSQAKTSQLNANDYRANILPDGVNRVLLIDDLFGRGNTANFCVNALKKNNLNVFVRFLSLTRNKFGGIHTKFICSLMSDGVPQIAKNGKESIVLHFTLNCIDEKVWIWEDSPHYQEVKNAYINGEFGKTFEFYMYQKPNRYWQIDDN
ncbi:hypothetical protein [Streptococcus anginosus]|uniref:Phosphoribosyltransferase n=1 Tax=Streptococcus anginosus TaxID=1328 RepID=A0A3S4LXI7_STRAP|nr:hypothetical protein [Streptococcus anginosus]GAD41080.1 hypothetical protein ANG3_1543 [Streptococcus intermedius SK54 = ATCC 27335]EGL45840.1 hypothetical protein HMPREF9966_1362 [Streptococcus anginosus SK52 = DSM 20563]MBZ2158325.1 hypothetical protein [Streptococcus anginosus]ORE81270.1 hypothetical protein B6C93_08690 [Streptococcus anginosus SK52 = DSM 20563]UEB01603.1 hypothetical protein LK450_06570 [Streptococcus anginosus subsp. anginosus]